MEWEDVYDADVWSEVAKELDSDSSFTNSVGIGVSRIMSITLERDPCAMDSAYQAEIEYFHRNWYIDSHRINMYSSEGDWYSDIEGCVHRLLDKAFRFYGIQIIVDESIYFRYRDTLDTDIGKIVVSTNDHLLGKKAVEISYRTEFE